MLQDGISAILGVSRTLDTRRYLVLPSLVGKNKRQVFAYVKHHIWNQIKSWRGRFLSNEGKEVLIKAVQQSIPTYCMNAFLLPTTLAEEIKRMMNS
ncbi:hypothetical protein LINPERPRIM_LOCUS33548, partial [Linum perenne]